MPLDFKPHTLQAFPPQQPATVAGEALPVRPATSGSAFTGQVTPISSEAAYRTYGVETRESYELLCDLEDGRALALESALWWADESAWFKVAAEPKLWGADPDTSCAQVLLTRNRLKTGAPT